MSIKEKILQGKEAKRAKRKVFPDFDIADLCGDHIKQFEMATHNGTRKVACCARRAGKTMGQAAELLLKALKIPGGLVYYICNTIGTAEGVIWRDLVDLVMKYYPENQLYINITKHEIMLPNKSLIKLMGCPDLRAINNFLGKAYTHVTIDEAQDFNPMVLDQLIRKAIDSALDDYNGSLSIIGTPPRVHFGPFFDAFHGNAPYADWDKFAWTAKENPHFWRKRAANGKAGGWEEYIREKLEKSGLDEPDATILRENFGQWVQGEDELVYKGFTWDKNEYVKLPNSKAEYHYVVGVDLGSRDATGIVVGAFSYNDPTLYIVEDFKQASMDISHLTSVLKGFIKKYNPDMVVFDPAAGGANWVDEVNARYGVPAMSADKMDKQYFIKIFNDTLRKGNIKLTDESGLPDEWGKLSWKTTQNGDIKEDKAQDNHLSDACLYMFRYCYSYAWETQKPERPGPHQEGYDDWVIEQQEKEIKADREEQRYWEDYNDY